MKSDAQARNEEEVRKIMAERGYGRSSAKKKHNNTGKIIAVFVVLLALAIPSALYINNNKNESDEAKSNNPPSTVTANEPEETPEETEIEPESSNEISANGSPDFEMPEISYEKYNVDLEYVDSDNVRHYSDGSTFDPHHCDAQYTKYQTAKDEGERLQAVYDETFKNQASFNDLYEQAGHNIALAEAWMKIEQQAVDDALKAVQEAHDNANSIYWDEIVPCEKEMYDIK